MDLGLFKYGINSDGALEVQGFNCRFGEGTIMTAMAVRAFGKTVTIINEEVALDGVLVNFDGSQPACLSTHGQVTNVDAEDGCWHSTSTMVDHRQGAPPGTYWHEFNLDIAKQHASSEGVCGSEDGRDPVRLSDSLFSSAELGRLYALCPETPHVQRRLNDDPPITSPEKVCQVAANITYEDASMECESLIGKNQFYKSCIYDYCATGLKAMVQNANSSAVR